MEKLELLQRIGDSVCEGCGPNADCGIEPPKCQRINSAAIALDKYVNIENQQEGNKSAFSEGLEGSITVPRDSRTKKAQVTSEMKKMCIGAFTFMRDSHHDDFGDAVVETIEVPWTTVKEIYKAMVEAAERTAA